MSDFLLLTFKSRIQSNFDQFTTAEKKLANYIIGHPEEIVNDSAMELAGKVGVSPATVIRFSKSCGFMGYSDLKTSVWRELTTENRNFKPGDLSERDSLGTLKQKMMGYHLQVAQSVLANWNEESYLHAADVILKSKDIFVVGYGGSKAAAVALVDLLFLLDLPCDMWEDPSFASMRIGRIDANSTVIGITFTGRYFDTVQMLKLAKSKKATTIGITGFMDSELIKYSDIVLNTNLPEEEYLSSTISARISEMAVIEVLFSILALRTGKKEENLRYNDEILELRRTPK